MRIKSLSLRNFCGYEKADFRFGDFSCLLGPNGCGKTTVLNAVSLLCSSLYFGEEGLSGNIEDDQPEEDDWKPTITPEQRLRAYLQKNIRFFGEPGGSSSFVAEGTFEHEGKELVVRATEAGFARNDVIGQEWWWPGIVYFARFDSDMVNFQLRLDLWPRFKERYEGITGLPIEPEIMVETDLEDMGQDGRMVVGFWLTKDGSRVHSRKASAGEKKIGKALSQAVNLERPPHIVLVDNMEMHVYYKRHLRMFEEIKSLFAGRQIITTTHSVVVMNEYEPRSHLVDIEALERRSHETPQAASESPEDGQGGQGPS